jgi:hypothetical protein
VLPFAIIGILLLPNCLASALGGHRHDLVTPAGERQYTFGRSVSKSSELQAYKQFFVRDKELKRIMPKKMGPNSKAVEAKAKKEDAKKSKQVAEERQKEEREWLDAGEGARTKAQAKKEEQVRFSLTLAAMVYVHSNGDLAIFTK